MPGNPYSQLYLLQAKNGIVQELQHFSTLFLLKC